MIFELWKIYFPKRTKYRFLLNNSVVQGLYQIDGIKSDYIVITKSHKYTSLPIAEIAALFHDLGKINPNFQKKLEGLAVNEYSKHSYLSVLAFFYCLWLYLFLLTNIRVEMPKLLELFSNVIGLLFL